MRAVGYPTRITTHVRLPTDQAGNPLADPLSAYRVSDVDSYSDPKFYGFLSADGAWYILKENSTANTYRYAAGKEDYAAAWADRVNLAYGYFDAIF